MVFPARFAAVKPPPEAYEQRLRGAGKYSDDTISSLVNQTAIEVEGSDVSVVNEEAQIAATVLDDFLYETEGEGKTTGEDADEKAEEMEAKADENTRSMENGEGAGEHSAVETNAETTEECKDQEMKETPADA